MNFTLMDQKLQDPQKKDFIDSFKLPDDSEDSENKRTLGFENPRNEVEKFFNSVYGKEYLNKSYAFYKSLGDNGIARVNVNGTSYVIKLKNNVLQLHSFSSDAVGQTLALISQVLFEITLDQANVFAGTESGQGDVLLAGGFSPNSYVRAFVKAFPRFGKFVGSGKMEIHHRIPKIYRKLFGNDAIDNLSNLVALPKAFHRKVVNGLWSGFAKKFPNPTKAQVSKYTRIVDMIIGDIGNNMDEISKMGF